MGYVWDMVLWALMWFAIGAILGAGFAVLWRAGKRRSASRQPVPQPRPLPADAPPTARIPGVPRPREPGGKTALAERKAPQR